MSLRQAFGRLDPDNHAARVRLVATLHLKHGYTQAQIAAHPGLHHAIVNWKTDARSKKQDLTPSLRRPGFLGHF
jgi:DNA-binding transcriptional regulator LsrR (DeoR family)